MKALIPCLFVLIAYSSYAQQNNEKSTKAEPTVNTSAGKIRGTIEGDVSVFKGIPYAAPPVGEFRWRPPQPVTPWKGVRDAGKFGPDCAQAGWGAAPGTIQKGSSEDCLYLNVWEPADTKPGSKLPVMVWIHGGGFTGGSGSSPQNFGNQFARQGIILITFNYRLGRLGFFAFPALSKEHPEEPKGNYGYMDQIAALKWIKDNIAAFGGNPGNVTIFGFSAGGVSVHSLLTIPAAKGLFQKAISESGGGRDGVLTGRPMDKDNADSLYPVSAETIGVNFAHKHGIQGTDASALAKLRALSVEDIVDGGQETDGQGGARIYSGPIFDGKLVVETAENAYKAGKEAKVPLIIGNCSGEIGGNFVNNSTTKNELLSTFGKLENGAKAAYDPGRNKPFAEVNTKFNTDWVWAEPARFVARVFVAKGEPVFVYNFGYVPVNMKQMMQYGAGHGSEVPYVFNNLTSRWGATEATPEEKKLAEMMNTYWANFAKNGNPNGSGLPLWPKYITQNEEILEIQPDANIVSKPDPRKARLDVIEKAFRFRTRIQTRSGI